MKMKQKQVQKQETNKGRNGIATIKFSRRRKAKMGNVVDTQTDLSSRPRNKETSSYTAASAEEAAPNRN